LFLSCDHDVVKSVNGQGQWWTKRKR
jgi:hypothetical protein